MNPRTTAASSEAITRGDLRFPAIRSVDGGRVSYTGRMSVFDLIEKGFARLTESHGLTPEILDLVQRDGVAVQRKTSASHVQAIVDYTIKQAESGEPFAFNAIMFYTDEDVDFQSNTHGFEQAGEARLTKAVVTAEGYHRMLHWAVLLGYKVKGVRRPEMSEAAQKRIEAATIPVIVVVDEDLSRQMNDFHSLNQQKPLNATVLALTDDTVLSKLTRQVIRDVKLFHDRIDINAASVGRTSHNLLSFAQLRFVVASFLVGRNTRSPEKMEVATRTIVEDQGLEETQKRLREAFVAVAEKFAGLEQLHKDRVPKPGEFIVELRNKTLLSSNAAWRALFVALNERPAGVSVEDAVERVAHSETFPWTRESDFFAGNLLDVDEETGKLTGKILSSRESIDRATDKLTERMAA